MLHRVEGDGNGKIPKAPVLPHQLALIRENHIGYLLLCGKVSGHLDLDLGYCLGSERLPIRIAGPCRHH